MATGGDHGVSACDVPWPGLPICNCFTQAVKPCPVHHGGAFGAYRGFITGNPPGEPQPEVGLSDADVERIARRVVELMKAGA